MNAREERLVTENNLWELDTWLDKADVFAKPHYDYVNSQLVNTGIKFGNGPTRMTAFIGDTIVRHEDGSHTVLSAKDTAELARLRAERHSTNEALSDAAEQLRVQRDRIAELEGAAVCPSVARFQGSQCVLPVRHRGDHQDASKRHYWSDEYATPVRQAEDPHDSPLHHDYAECRDLPFVPGQQDRRAL